MVRITPNPAAFNRLRRIGEAMTISEGDLSGPVLRDLGRVHRKQMTAAFVSQGGSTLAGPWAPLNPRYAERKKSVLRAFRAEQRKKRVIGKPKKKAKPKKRSEPRKRASGRGGQKILQLSGDTRKRFTKATDPNYVQAHLGAGKFTFGAASDVAAAHFAGDPSQAPHQSDLARQVFGGIAPRLAVRNMISKTPAQFKEFVQAVVVWYSKRANQVLRHLGKTIKPGGLT